MFSPETDLLFPPHILPALQDMRGSVWQELVNSVISAEPNGLDQVAFVLMMARINNCATCNSHSYRAKNGCTACTKQSLKRIYKADEALIEVFKTTRKEVEQYLQKRA
jgi:hypothetical protein